MPEYKAGTYEIYRALSVGKRRFSELEKEVPTKTLAERLKVLEKTGHVTRNILHDRPPRSVYEITEKGKTEFSEMVFNLYRQYAETAYSIAPDQAISIIEPYLQKLGYRITEERLRTPTPGGPRIQTGAEIAQREIVIDLLQKQSLTESDLQRITGLDRKTINTRLEKLQKRNPDIIEIESLDKGVRAYRINKESKTTELLKSFFDQIKGDSD